MKIVYALLISLSCMPLIAHTTSNESFLQYVGNAQIEVPRKAAKRLLLLKERIDKKHQAHLSAFMKVSNLLEQGELTISKQLVNQSLKELQNIIPLLSSENIHEHEIIRLYLPKIEEELADAPIIQAEIRQSMTIGTSGICCSGQVSPCQNSFFCTSAESEVSSGVFTTPVAITNAAQSFDCGSGALTVLGGVGIQGSLNVCGIETIFNTTNSTNPNNGALVVEGGVGIAKNLNVGGSLTVNGTTTITNTTQSESCDTGALTIGGGVGIEGNLNVCGTTTITNTTNSSNCTDGAFVVEGGVGIGENLNVCGNTTIGGSLTVIEGATINDYLIVNGLITINGSLTVTQGATIDDYLIVNGPTTINGCLDINGCGIFINGNPVINPNKANCNLSIGEFTNNVANGMADTAVGQHAMQNNLMGIDNTAVGCSALQNSTNGNDNTAIGAFALETLTGDGSLGNTALGSGALFSAKSPDYCTALGVHALYDNQQREITAVGAFALLENFDGYLNTAVGFEAMRDNFDGDYNTAVGHSAMSYNTSGYWNTAVGSEALVYNDSLTRQ